MNTTTLSISELRQNASSVLKDIVGKKEAKIILQRSKPTAVIVDFDYFQALEEMLVDTTDSREANRARKETRIPFDVYLKKRWG